jgi:hypothetical protein
LIYIKQVSNLLSNFLGVGHTTRLYSIFTPLHSTKPQNSVTKETQFEKEAELLLQQEGSGNYDSGTEDIR